MKVLILANQDLASNYALNLLLPKLRGHSLYLMLSSAVGGGKRRAPQLEMLKFFEQSLFNDIVFPLLDYGAQAQMRSFHGLSSMLRSAPVIENHINSEDGIAKVSTISPDLILSIRYGGILRDAVISLPPLGVINLHSGLLPSYRGVMASFWAMLAGDQELGTTLHFIEDSSIDTGGVISQTLNPLVPGKSYLWQVINLYADGVAEMAAAVETLASGGSLNATVQSSGGHYYSFPGPEELDCFTISGHALFDPSEVTELIQMYYLEPSI
ncbi:formyl transferase [Congregibacter litoralis]|uniref:Methionyl-tRNA formyltransferase n=1 Tax=Congregibacter litoralis KT71 TaxID=314285 RepID=A4A6X8_9GAMM|nr:formyl transferase [Congregibacter litoralis]EAQ98047.1 Methionyl-tRNA formyltransferase [Congregibacter litoralis KT71]